MYLLIKKLPMVAFVIAIVSAFAFNQPVEENLSTEWFAVETDGDVITPALSSKPSCDTGMEYCAVEFSSDDVVNGQPPVQNVEDPDADLYIIDLTHRDVN